MKKRNNRYISNFKTIRLLGFSSLLALIILAISTLIPVYVKSETAEATPITSTTSIEITSSSTKASVEVIPASSSGTFATSTSEEEIAFSVTTNNLTGYTLSIVGSGDGTLVNTNDNSAVLDSISSITDLDTFSNSTSSNYINKWGVKPSKLNSTNNTNYLPAPTTSNTITMDTTSSANPTTANDYTIGLGAKVNYEKPSGIYTNTFTLLATARPMMYEIIYSNGGISDVTGTVPTTESNTTAISGITLANNTLSRSTYTFAGWCDGEINTTTEYDATTKTYYNPGTKCNGTSAYDTSSPNEDVYLASSTYSFKDKTISDTTNNQVTLTAVWKPTTFDDAYGTTGTKYMQNMTSAICGKVTPNQYVSLVDNRDNMTYVVGKLEDNKCWMVDNLNLDLTNTTVINTLSDTNTHATTTALSYLKNGGGSTTNRWPINGLSKSSWSSGLSYSAPLLNTGGNCSTESRYPCTYTGTYNNNTILSAKTPGISVFGVSSGRIGIFYNFCTASAGSYCFGDGTSAGTAATGNASLDICPYNWKLPRGDENGDFQYLATILSVNYPETYLNATSPYSFQSMFGILLSGSFHTSDSWRQGAYNYIWSSTNDSENPTNHMHAFVATSSSILPHHQYPRYTGISVRCIAQN